MFRATLRNLTKFRLYTGNADCTLCEVAKENLNKLNLKYENFNIYDNNNSDAAYWRELYKYDVPVLHFEEEEIMRHRIHLESLKDFIEKNKLENEVKP